ncbi:MAG TPA: DNA cytosine methyltransferase [Patescibacteria group bacterium]|nr:DNA cytosine methyltransferase [Patescibacteria group bacterium]
MSPLVSVDLFAGGGGASEGIRRATGHAPIVAINHNPAAIEMHRANHPGTLHLLESVWEVSPSATVRRGEVDLLWLSPDCTHFSRAKGGAPKRDREIRSLAWVGVEWARTVRPRVICLENVGEFVTWGPLDADDKPIPERKGETFRAFVGRLEMLGYRVEWRVLCAADYGAPTSRRRLFLVARCDGEAIVWPAPTHGPGRPSPWRTAAECIDWSIPCPSIFERKKPLAEATQRRIAEGVRRYVLSGSPYIVQTGHQSSDGGKVRGIDEPLSTVVTKAEHLLVSPALARVGNGERKGQRPRAEDIQQALTTVTGTHRHALVAAFLAKHNGGATGQPLDTPAHTIAGNINRGPVAVFLDKMHGSARAGIPLDQPAPTITAGGERGGGHAALVAAFLLRYYSQGGQWGAVGEPMHTIVSKARMGLVTVDLAGEEYALVDIGMRMLQPRELLAAQFSPEVAEGYVLTGTKSQQVARIGNSVPPLVVEAIVRAQFGFGARREAA